MKKYRLAMLCIGALALSACSSVSDKQNDNSYKGEVVASSYADNGKVLKLSIAHTNCEQRTTENVTVVEYPYDSNIVVGACVKVDMDDQNKVTSITNISRSKSSSILSRTGQY